MKVGDRSWQWQVGWRDYWVGFSRRHCPYQDSRAADWYAGFDAATRIDAGHRDQTVTIRPPIDPGNGLGL